MPSTCMRLQLFDVCLFAVFLTRVYRNDLSSFPAGLCLLYFMQVRCRSLLVTFLSIQTWDDRQFCDRF